jgi:hypothetical protein
MKEPIISAGQYAGAISRWCDLHRKTPVALPKTSKSMAEFELFNSFLDHLAAERRKKPDLSKPPTSPPARIS